MFVTPECGLFRNRGCSGTSPFNLDFKQDLYWYSFYPHSESVWSETYKGVISDKDFTSIDKLIAPGTNTVLIIIEKFHLIRSLVETVLQFHNMLWMKDMLKLGDLSFFRHGKDLASSLRTLYLSIEFVQLGTQLATVNTCPILVAFLDNNALLTPLNSTPEGSISLINPDDQLRYGIYNIPLYSLGVALLQIDRWSALDPEDVLSVRKIAASPLSLSLRFLKMANKCLRCGFGYRTDLRKPQLRKAVYDSLVGALDHLIKCLDVSEEG